MNSGRWPRPDYIRDEVEADVITALRVCGESGSHLVDLLSRVPRNEREICQVFAQLLAADWQVGAAGAVGGELAAISPVQGVAGIGSYEAGAAAALKLSGIAWVDGLKAAFSLHLLVLASALVSAGIALLASVIFRNRVASDDARTNKTSQEP